MPTGPRDPRRERLVGLLLLGIAVVLLVSSVTWFGSGRAGVGLGQVVLGGVVAAGAGPPAGPGRAPGGAPWRASAVSSSAAAGPPAEIRSAGGADAPGVDGPRPLVPVLAP